MQFGFNLPISGPVLSPEHITRLAQAGEAIGYDYLTLTDHVLLHSFRRPHDWPRWFAAAGIPDRKIEREIVFENSSLTCQGAIDGLGVAIAQAAFVRDELASGRLMCPIDLPLRTDFGYYLVCPKEKTRQKKIRLFQSWIASEASAPN